MKRASPTTYRVGSIGEFAAWTKRVVRDPGHAAGDPKQWFDSETTARQSQSGHGSGEVSAEAMVKLLSPENLAILNAINRHRPSSLHELAALTGRKESSLSRTLKRLAQAGIVAFESGPNRRRVPSLIATRVHLEIDLTGARSAVALE
ncbi:MAG: MarR family transcriptional regulator [Acetobacteraceae bacterium]